MTIADHSPERCRTDFAGFKAYCLNRHYDHDGIARACNIVSRLHDAGLNDAAISSLSWEHLCSLVRGRPYDSKSDRSLARTIRRYLDYLHCSPSSGIPVDQAEILVVPLLPRPRQSTKDRVISYIKLHGGSWVNAAVLSRRFNVYTHTLLSQLSECNSIEISRPADYRDEVRYRYVSPEGP